MGSSSRKIVLNSSDGNAAGTAGICVPQNSSPPSPSSREGLDGDAGDQQGYVLYVFGIFILADTQKLQTGSRALSVGARSDASCLARTSLATFLRRPSVALVARASGWRSAEAHLAIFG